MKSNAQNFAGQPIRTSKMDVKRHTTPTPKEKDRNKEEDPYIAVIRKALISLLGEVQDTKLLVETVRLRVNEKIPSGFELERDSNKLLTKMLRFMGLKVVPGNRFTAAVIWDAEVIFKPSFFT